MNARVNRRYFLQQAAVIAAGVAGAARLHAAANDALNVGCIGTGGRCRHLMKSLVKVPGVRIAAVCDVYDVNLEEGRKLADTKAFATKRYQELLDRKDIDAVLIGTPDHWHVPLTVAAGAAGKDVYVEKPLTHDLSEGKAAIEAVHKHQRIVQVGMQQRSMPHIQKGYEICKEGRLGQLLKVHLTWNRNTDRIRKNALNIDPKRVDWKTFLGNARPQPFDEYRFRNWRWFWDFGGGILTDLMVHWIDVAHWFLGTDHPERATALGMHFMSQGIWETPDTIQTVLAYPGNVQVHFEGTFSNAREGAMIAFMGTEGTLYIDRGRYEFQPERTSKRPYEEWVLGTGKRGADFYDKPDGELLHLRNWVECVRSRKQPNAPVEAGVSAAGAAHLGNQAYRTGQVAVWNSTR